MADSYSLRDQGYGLAGASGHSLMPLVDETERVTRAFEDLLRIEREQELQSRRELDLEERRKRLGAERLRQIEAEARAMRNTLDASQKTADSITSVGRVLADVLGGRLLSALQGVVGMVQKTAGNQIQGLAKASKGAAPGVPGLSGQAASSPGAIAGEAGEAGGLAGVAGAAGVAAAAITAVAAAAQAAYGTFMKLASAALPQGVQALGTAFKYLWAVIGQAVMPYLLLLGAAVIFAADLIKDLMPQIMSMFEDGGDLFVRAVTLAVKGILAPVVLLENGVKVVVMGMMGLMQGLAYAMAWLLKKAQFKTRGKQLDAVGDYFGEQFKEMKKADTVTDVIGKKLAEMIGGVKIGGKGLKERFGDAVGKFAGAVQMGSTQGTAGFEGIDAAYKRIQEFAAGTTPIEQELLDTQQKALKALLDMAGGIKEIEKKTKPAIAP